MRYVAARDLRNNPSGVWEALEQDEVIITSHGQPQALMIPLVGDDATEAIDAWRQAQAMRALARAQAESVAAGRDAMTMDSIDAVIAATRASRRTV